MTILEVWPPELPPGLKLLPSRVAELLHATPEPVGALDDLCRPGAPLLVVLGSPADGDVDTLFPTLGTLLPERRDPVVLVVGDGWIGTDGPDLAAATTGAGAVSLARSIAVRRTATPRTNVVCVPESLFGRAASQRGPLPIAITAADVAEVVAFALSEGAFYVDGQVFFADGGRQLFSSLTA